MSQLKICLLGSPLIEVDRVPIEPGRRKTTALLAYLAVTNQPHSRDTLATLLWPDYSQGNARAALRSVLNSGKAVLGDHWLQADRELVALKQDENCQVDVSEFQRFIAERQIHSHVDGLVCSHCIRVLRKAVEIYRGDFMAGFTLPDSFSFDEWQAFQTDQLRQEYVFALEDLVKGLGAARDFQPAIKYAQQWLGLDEFHEPAHRHLMQLYAWSNQRAAAMRQYEACQKALAELGVAPEAATVALYRTIREGPLPLPEIKVARQTLTPLYLRQLPTTRLHNLPVKLTPFLARETELKQIADLLADPACRLLTLNGLGGIGKTRLALEAAEDQANCFEQGVFYVALTPVNSPGLLMQAISSALLFTAQGSEDLQIQLFRFLREKELLLILDNFEHLMDEAMLISDLLAAAPHVKILTTSREPLALQEEWLLRIDGMPFPDSEIVEKAESYDAIQLFVQSARRLQPSFSLTRDLPFVVRICRLLEGMPLGIELAAGNLFTITCEQIAEQIEHSVNFLATAIRNVPARHRSLQAVFEHSWNLLSAAQQSALMYVSVFRGGFTLEAGIEVTQAAEDDLKSLVDKSLIDVDSAGRYSLHEMIRQFAEEKLVASEAEDSVRFRHLEYFCSLAETAETRLQRADQLEWLQRLDMEQGNLRVALDKSVKHQNSEMALRLVGALWRYWAIRIPFADGRRSIVTALEIPGSDRLLRARALYGIGSLSRAQGDYPAAQAYYKESLDLFGQLHNPQGIANAITGQGIVDYRQGDYQHAQARLQEALDIFRSVNDQMGIAFALHNLAASTNDQGGDYETPMRLLNEALAIRETLGDKQGIANVIYNLGILAHDTGDFPNARAHYETSFVLFNELGDQRTAANVLNNLADIANREKDYETAQALLESCLAIRNDLGDQRGRAFVLIALSEAALAQGAVDNAALLLRESLTIFHGAGEKRNLVYVLQGLGSVARAAGNNIRAARLFGASDRLRAVLAMIMPPSDRQGFDRELAVIQAELGEVVFQQEYGIGMSMTLDDAITFALL